MKKLTNNDWVLVFKLRCKSKKGESLTDKEQKLINKAFEEDGDRYIKMDKDVCVASHSTFWKFYN
jgi:hypothetical protein